MICTPICGRLTRRSLAVQRYFSLMSTHTGFKKVALILHGCGVFDGSEIHEATSLCCIAPVLAARCLPGVHVTTGTDAGTARAIKSMGAVHEKCEITEVCVDENLKVVTAPAYMCATATIADIFDNIGLLVKKVLSLTN
ncbi:ES1 protein [Echinococcus granulosus]|uniref:ES1 protein n=1 Tax=Echinococcus granulosus TaxID=6210 RepID=W6URK8_ECHGR|nr:ES1 protein [Echinococcus granulosus]EUB64365.1 ES1 protein [Echinococcus granulosus]